MISNNKFLLLGFLLLALMIAVGFYVYHKAPRNVRTSEAVDIAATQLYNEYTINSAAAQLAFSGKVLAVTGTVAGVTKNQDGHVIVLLETGVPGAYINCSLDETADLKLSRVVTVKGYCTGIGHADEELGLQGDVYLARSVLQQEKSNSTSRK